MEFPDVSDTWRAFGSQQSLLRLRQADHAALHDADAATTAGAIASSAGVASSAAESSQAKATSASTAVLPQNQYGFQQRSRIHIVVEDPSQLHSLNATNATLQSYDIVSVSSTNEKLFHSCVSHESVDIVVIEVSRKLPFYLKKPAMNLAFERGIHFEFSYSPSIRDMSSRRYLFANLLSMLRLTKGRNLILSSAATKEMEMRAPWDVINIGVLAGIDAATSKATISSYARSVLLHAESRKTIKCVLKEVKLQTVSSEANLPTQTKHHPKPTQNDEETKHKDKKMKTTK